ncbi:MAG TPA: kelch repeat-containing protein, partial [Acidimicrobiales bacterium]|nr:kelch repeat-containing protein [Acidimicrobiales bacterium]
KVLAAGGSDSVGASIASAEQYDPVAGTWSATGSLATARSNMSATELPGGLVLITGGLANATTTLGSTETYDAGTVNAFTTASRLAVVANSAANLPLSTSNPAVSVITTVGTLPVGLSLTSGVNGRATITGTTTAVPGTYHVGLFGLAAGAVVAYQRLTIVVESTPAPRYLVALKSGTVYSYGTAPAIASQVAVNAKNRPVVGIATSPTGTGYYLATALGNVYNEGGATFYGSAAKVKLSAPISGIAVTPDGGGYWLVAKDGTVYPFGDAASYSGLKVNVKNRPIVAITASPDGKGYYLTSALGNVFNYGDALFYGSEARQRLTAAVTSLKLTPSGLGYVLTDAKGEIFIHGDASAFGSKAGIRIPHPVVDVGLSLDAAGYYIVTSGGNVYNDGDAPFLGSPVHQVKDGALVAAIAVTN